MEKELDVRAWTLRCLAALQQCVPRLGGHGLQMAQSLCKRFDSWISGIGVLAEYHVSLDYRLREAPRLAGALLDMLQILELQITRVSKGAEAYALDEPDKPAADYQPLHELDSMNNTIGWLHNFSYIVRGSGVRDPLSRAARFKLKKEEREAVDALESAVRDILDRFPLCSSLADRIANAVVLRRKYFLHCRAHQERLSRRLEESHHQEEPGMSEQAEEPDSEPQPREDAQSPQAAAGSSGNPISARNVSSTHADSKTEVTDVLEDGAYVDDAAPQPPPTDASSWLGYTGVVEIPRAPDIEGSKEYRCPYCCLTLPADVFTDDERWRRHIVKDLWPYVCVHEDCPFPEELFSSSRAWRGHLRKPHKSEWVCPLHPDTGANMSGAEQGEDLAGVFRSEEAFQAHMDTHHVGAFSEKQINALKRRSHRTLRAVVSCPFCDLEDRRGPGETQHLPDGVNIYQHIGEHLLALALMSLPPRDDLAEDENDRVDLEGASDFKRALAQLSTYNPLDQLSLQGSIDHLADPSKDDEEFGPGQPIEDPTANAFSELALLATTDSELAQEAPALGADETPASTIAPHSPQWLDEDNQSDEEDQHDLKKSILERLVPSALDNLEFLPAGLIDKLVSYEVVTRHLGFDDLSHSYAERQLYQGSSPLAAAPESQTLPERIEGSYRKRQLATSTNRFTKQNFSLASLAEAMQQPVENGGIQLQNRRWHLRLYMNCFIGSDMTTWLLENFVDLEDRREAEALGNRLMVPEDDEPEGEGNEATKKAKKESDGLFIHVERRHQFRDGNYYYQFSSEYAKPNPAGWFTKTKKAMVVPSTSEQQELVGYVIYEAKKLFATCVLAGLGGKSLHRAMSQFRQLGFNDLSLPITDEIMPRIPFFGSKMSEYTWPWDSSSILNFCKQQWVFLAPIFPSVTYELDLQPGYILPFTFISDILNDGTSSILYQATIHPAHCRYNSPTAADGSLKVALKEIKRRRTGDAQLAMSLERDWQRSLAAHRQARSFNHPNIIRPLAAIVRNPTAYLMYEWADGGNLRDYWRSNRRPDLTPRFIKLMVEQLRGLADALETLHNSEGGSYRHGDIKPENILRLRGEGLAEAQADLGVLKLSGFGIARYHEEVTAVRHSATTTMSSPRMYEAPGAATSFNQPRSRRYDIWSMGCVILEFIAWALYGHDGLEVMDSRIAGDFGRPSPLYVIDRTGFANTARLHPEVNTIMNVIAADRECRGHTALGDLLRLVRDRLLVVNLSLQQSLLSASKSEQLPSIIISDPTGPSERQSAPDFEAVPPDNGIARADAGELRDALETIIRRGNVSENYWFTRTSRAGTSLSLGVGPEQLPTWSVSESLRSAPSGGKRPQASTISQGGIPEFTSSEDVDEHLDDGLEHRQRDLRDQLFSALVTTRSGEDRFLPNGLLTSLITESRVRNELSISIKRYQSAFNIPQLARTICEGNAGRAPLEIHADQRGFPSFRRVFATLAMIDKTNEILEFITHDVRDSHLPLTRLTQSLDSQDGEFVLGDRGTALEFTRKWGPVAIEHFERLQWATLSPFFSKSEMRSQTNHYALQDQIILPFVKQDLFRRTALEETMGGHSVVFKVYIHPDHHNFGDGSQKFMPFAIKQLLTANKEAFEKEVSVLRRFSHDAHPHLLSLLATYQQSEKFNIILPWATADLEEYWRTTNPRPRFEQATVTWVAEQCYGIANGLVRIHRYAESDYSSVYKDDQYVFGHHGNVIPQNILWFAATESGKIGGTLKLSNFGTTGWAADATETLVVSPTYRAPESDQRGFRISRAYDMWSLGCLYLEFVTWLLGGWEMVQQFAKLRMSVDATWYEMQIDTFFDLVKSDDGHEMGARVKPAVTKFIEQLHGHTFCSDFVHDFLDIIQHRLLVVLPQDTARNDAPGTGRVSCEQLDHELRRIRNLCQEDVAYASRPSPRV